MQEINSANSAQFRPAQQHKNILWWKVTKIVLRGSLKC